MFVQVIQGRLNDAAALEKRLETWIEQVAPGAEGFIGSTSGVTSDGTAITIARFESEDAARSNSDRPEQGEWWAETEKVFDGPVTFRDTTDVTVWGEGGSDDAGFVQIMQGRMRDRSRAERLMEQSDAQLREMRPDVIGGQVAWFGDEFVEAVYFTSEAEARDAEKRTEDARPAELQEMMDLMEDTTFHDITAPILHSAG